MPSPNIVLIMTDQQRADFTRSESFPLDTTPFLDSLGRRGARFRHAYTPMPVCAPARTSMFTGRFPKAHRVRQNSAIKNVYRPDGLPDLVDVLRQRGYSINLVGKNHSYLPPEAFDFYASYNHRGGGRPGTKTPEEESFDAWLLDLSQQRGSLSLEPTPFPLDVQLPHRIVRDAIECVDTRAGTPDGHGGARGGNDRPFFLWLSFPEPHNPYQVPGPYFGLFPEDQVPDRVAGPEEAERRGGKWLWERTTIERSRPGYDAHWRRYRANYCGMLRLIDDQVRRFCAHLEARGLLENTLVLFTADHGDYAGDYGLQRKGVGLPECLVRIPFILAGPGVVPQGEALRDEFVSLVDVMPTLCEATGALDAVPYGVQGRSLWPLLSGGDFPAEEFRSIYAELGYGGLHYGADEEPPLHYRRGGPYFDELNAVTQSGNLKMVRMGRWKLTFDMMGAGQLFDVESDPGELHDRYADPAVRDVRQALTDELLKWTIRTEDDLPGAAYHPKRAARNWYAN
jgi:arylsulfatase A-like enzyme